jgi:hypothetical protein
MESQGLRELDDLLRQHGKHGAGCKASPPFSGWRPGDHSACTCWLGRALRLLFSERMSFSRVAAP